MAISRLALVVGALALLLMPAAALGYRSGLVPLPLALLQGMRWAAYLGHLALALGIVGLVLAARRRARRGIVMSVAALALAAVAIWVPWSWQQQARRVPPIHDITTDTANPPTYQAVVPLRANAPNTLDYDPKVGEQQRQAYPEIVPLTVPEQPGDVFERALTAAQDAGWEIVASDAQAGRIEATDTTFWFGFKDDVVIRLTPAGSGTRVDVRSVSRVGRSDVGTNARRIRAYLESLRGGPA
jgi:uncharacterized protein (DUF1499 family)